MIAPQPMILITIENSVPIIGIKVIKLTKRKPKITVPMVEGFFLLKAFARLSPKKQKIIILPKILTAIPNAISVMRMGIPINTSVSTAEKRINPV